MDIKSMFEKSEEAARNKHLLLDFEIVPSYTHHCVVKVTVSNGLSGRDRAMVTRVMGVNDEIVRVNPYAEAQRAATILGITAFLEPDKEANVMRELNRCYWKPGEGNSSNASNAASGRQKTERQDEGKREANAAASVSQKADNTAAQANGAGQNAPTQKPVEDKKTQEQTASANAQTKPAVTNETPNKTPEPSAAQNTQKTPAATQSEKADKEKEIEEADCVIRYTFARGRKLSEILDPALNENYVSDKRNLDGLYVARNRTNLGEARMAEIRKVVRYYDLCGIKLTVDPNAGNVAHA